MFCWKYGTKRVLIHQRARYRSMRYCRQTKIFGYGTSTLPSNGVTWWINLKRYSNSRQKKRSNSRQYLNNARWPLLFDVLSRPITAEGFLWPACNARRFYAQRPLPPLDTSDGWGPQSQCGPMKKSWFGDWRTPKGLPTASAPETDKQIGRQGDHCWRA